MVLYRLFCMVVMVALASTTASAIEPHDRTYYCAPEAVGGFSANPLTFAGWRVKNDQLARRVLFFAMIAADAFAHAQDYQSATATQVCS